MAQIPLLIKTLKRELHYHGKTYRDVALELNLSEASVKRMFSLGNFAMHRLELICTRMLDIEMSQLFKLMEEDQHHIANLTYEQENELVSNLRLLLVAVCVRNHWAMEDIVNTYQISEAECIALLSRLDQLELIELQPRNRIKLLIREDFRWIPSGPIEQFFRKNVQQEFLNAKFDQIGDSNMYLHGMISVESKAIFLKKLFNLASEFSDLINLDAPQPLAMKQNVGVVLALRSWDFSVFERLRK